MVPVGGRRHGACFAWRTIGFEHVHCRSATLVASTILSEGAHSMNSATAAVADAPLPKPEGLEGVVAAYTALSHVYGEEGRLVYRGYDIHELAGKASFEEVAYLLWRGHLPNRAELTEFQAKLDENRSLPPVVLEVLRALPEGTEPLDALRSGLSVLGPALG